jgi:hypothetical protein
MSYNFFYYENLLAFGKDHCALAVDLLAGELKVLLKSTENIRMYFYYNKIS